MKYLFRSPVGLMVITFDHAMSKWALFVGNMCHGHYVEPEDAAEDVRVHVTGCTEWDLLDGRVKAPASLEDWERA